MMTPTTIAVNASAMIRVLRSLKIDLSMRLMRSKIFSSARGSRDCEEALLLVELLRLRDLRTTFSSSPSTSTPKKLGVRA